MSQDNDPRAARREQILDVAMRIADRDGFDGLTMRKLASELGVSAPIVYRHFEDKAAIIDAIVEEMVAKQRLHDRSQMSWRDWLRTTFCSMYAELTAHPGLLELLASAGPFAEHAMRITDEVLAAFESAGFDHERSARAFRWIMGYTVGSVNMERGARDALAASKGTDLTESLRRYPRLFMAGIYLGGSHGQQGYEWCLDRMLDTLEADLANK